MFRQCSRQLFDAMRVACCDMKPRILTVNLLRRCTNAVTSCPRDRARSMICVPVCPVAPMVKILMHPSKSSDRATILLVTRVPIGLFTPDETSNNGERTGGFTRGKLDVTETASGLSVWRKPIGGATEPIPDVETSRVGDGRPKDLDSTGNLRSYRGLLFSIAYRMLGSVADAEDMLRRRPSSAGSKLQMKRFARHEHF